MSAIWQGNWLGSQNVSAKLCDQICSGAYRWPADLSLALDNGKQQTKRGHYHGSGLYFCIASVKSMKAFLAVPFKG